jgi:peptide alpha-N-acetyltransferase
MTETISYVDYTDEAMLPDIQRLVSRDLSEPYSVYTYRYFLHNCPRFCVCAYAPDPADASKQAMIATIVCKLEGEGDAMQGYMAMLAVDKAYRKQGIGKKLVTMVIDRMVEDGCKEVMLETEVCMQALQMTIIPSHCMYI